MAAFTLKLDDEILRKLAEAAGKAGVTPERMAEMMVEKGILAGEDFTDTPELSEPGRVWAGPPDKGGDPREDNAGSCDHNEVGRPWNEVRPEFMALIDKTFGEPE